MMILFNARIYTLYRQLPTASAICIQEVGNAENLDAKIVAVGSNQQIVSEFGPTNAQFDMGGEIIIPGLVDAHFHLKKYAQSLQLVDCETDNREECLRRVAARAESTSPGEWILGHGWNQGAWSEGFGDAGDLSAVTPDHLVYLTAKSLHAAWANQKALHMAKVDAQTKDPAGGRFQRYPDGEPTGFLFESAMQSVAHKIPQPTAAEIALAIQEALPDLWKVGLTGVHDFDRRHSFAALQILHQRKNLKLRVTKSIPVEDLSSAIGLGLRTGFGDNLLRIGSIKAFADGALGPHTAAMLQPYENEPQNLGILLMDREELFEFGQEASANGLSMAVHAIGDRANHEMIAAFEQLRTFEHTNNLPPLRHRIEHVQVLHPDDIHRLAAAQIIASMQPVHATSDMFVADRHWGERTSHAYAWRTLLEQNTRLAFGSDAPVEAPNPFWGIHAAVTRCRPNGAPGPDGWHPQQRLQVAEAIQGFTTGAAYAAGMEDRLGRLAPGYLADLIVLDKDPFLCAPEELRNIRPTATMIGGEWVYRS